MLLILDRDGMIRLKKLERLPAPTARRGLGKKRGK